MGVYDDPWEDLVLTHARQRARQLTFTTGDIISDLQPYISATLSTHESISRRIYAILSADGFIRRDFVDSGVITRRWTRGVS